MTRERWLALGALVLASAALGVAHGSEDWLGLVPCALCLQERTPYWLVIALSVAAVPLPRRWARPILLLAAIALLADVGLGFTHVGVEHGWWPSPLPECAAPRLGGGSFAERLARMPAIPAKPCDEPTYLVPGLAMSMAAMNMALALALSAGLAMSVLNGRRRP